MPESSPRPATCVCATAGTRLDRFVSEHWGPLPRRRTAAIIAAGAVRVNGRVARKGLPLQAGDVVELDARALEPGPLPTAPALRVLYEDAALIAVDKPAGLPSTALAGSPHDAAAHFLLTYAPETAHAGRIPLEGGLVHRLDTGTSGVLLAARTPAAWQAIREQFRLRAIGKRYVAWVAGHVSRAGRVIAPIAHHPRRHRIMRVCADGTHAAQLRARPAHTDYRPLEHHRDATLIEVTIDTGVRHQIRAHLAFVGHPLCGDTRYGGPAAVRLALHAVALRLRHPTDGRWLTLESAAPDDLYRP